jgi:prepilin-type N-terminal cleavage/methylation domain-containing protein
MYQTPWSQSTDACDKGFTLVEMLVAIAVLAILMTIALLSVPNHDDRYWRDNLDQLVASLNMAQ